jgi:hypothetical protein
MLKSHLATLATGSQARIDEVEMDWSGLDRFSGFQHGSVFVEFALDIRH